jgi:hypothetical protein
VFAGADADGYRLSRGGGLVAAAPERPPEACSRAQVCSRVSAGATRRQRRRLGSGNKSCRRLLAKAIVLFDEFDTLGVVRYFFDEQMRNFH